MFRNNKTIKQLYNYSLVCNRSRSVLPSIQIAKGESKIISLVGCNVESQEDVLRLKNEIDSWKTQMGENNFCHLYLNVSNTSTFPNASSYLESTIGTNLPISVIVDELPSSKFTLLKKLYNNISNKIENGEVNTDPSNTWILLSSSNGLWNDCRILPYRKLLEKLNGKGNSRSYAALFVTPGLLKFSEGLNNEKQSAIKEQIRVSEDAKRFIKSGDLELMGNETELYLYCIRMPVLGLFLNHASVELLNHPLSEYTLAKFLAFTNSRIARYEIPSKTGDWLYLDLSIPNVQSVNPNYVHLVNEYLQENQFELSEDLKMSIIYNVEKYCALFPPASDGTVRVQDTLKYLQYNISDLAPVLATASGRQVLEEVIREVVTHKDMQVLIRSPKLVSTSSAGFHDFMYLPANF